MGWAIANALCPSQQSKTNHLTFVMENNNKDLYDLSQRFYNYVHSKHTEITQSITYDPSLKGKIQVTFTNKKEQRIQLYNGNEFKEEEFQSYYDKIEF